jgi:hypothetical protein
MLTNSYGINAYKTTLVAFQLDAQNSYLFIYDMFIKILYISPGGTELELQLTH